MYIIQYWDKTIIKPENIKHITPSSEGLFYALTRKRSILIIQICPPIQLNNNQTSNSDIFLL